MTPIEYVGHEGQGFRVDLQNYFVIVEYKNETEKGPNQTAHIHRLIMVITTKFHVHPPKTQISLRIRPV